MLQALGGRAAAPGRLAALSGSLYALSLLKHLPGRASWAVASYSTRPPPMHHPHAGIRSSGSAANSDGNGHHSAVYVTDVGNNPTSHMPLLLGLINYFERHLPDGARCVRKHACAAWARGHAMAGAAWKVSARGDAPGRGAGRQVRPAYAPPEQPAQAGARARHSAAACPHAPCAHCAHLHHMRAKGTPSTPRMHPPSHQAHTHAHTHTQARTTKHAARRLCIRRTHRSGGARTGASWSRRLRWSRLWWTWPRARRPHPPWAWPRRACCRRSRASLRCCWWRGCCSRARCVVRLALC